VGMCANTLRYYGGWADKIEGKVIDTNHETFNYTKKEPVRFLGRRSRLRWNHFANKLLDWCLWPDHPLEFPTSYVGMEDWSSYRCWKHRTH
jgi:hypothetical protein